MEEIELNVELREECGSRQARRMRHQHIIPAVYYGKNEKSQSLKVRRKDLEQILSHGENVLIRLKWNEEPARMVMVKDIQYDPVEDNIIHADFCHISMREKIEVKVPIELSGVAKGVKEKNGVLEQALRELEIKCLPTQIPEKFTADVTQLDIGDSLTAEKIKVAQDIEILTSLDAVIVSVLAPTILKEEEEKPVEEAAQPELIKKERKEEEEIAPEETGKDKGKEEKKKE